MEMTKIQRVGIIMNGVTGRMGTNQHLMRSIVAIIRQGGITLSDDETILPDLSWLAVILRSWRVSPGLQEFKSGRRIWMRR